MHRKIFFASLAIMLPVLLTGCGSSAPEAVSPISGTQLAQMVRKWPVPLLSGKMVKPSTVMINPLSSSPSSIYANLINNSLNNASMGVPSNWRGLSVPAMWITDGRTTFNVGMYRGITDNPSLNTAVPVTNRRIDSLLLHIMHNHYMLLSRKTYTVLIQKISPTIADRLANSASSIIENLDTSSTAPSYLVLWVGQSALASRPST
ncbi:hypothetical protein [Sulfobacillus thermosulfidooxidans]|uniref:hypothetical protein n=1 Tax=Sulfobacillus thermosulfidooxidans TaxID=28034 RepID=UPI0004916C56|nr:hypothetical protein [Sulfobacillus thermosulfidooxidans]